MPPTTPTTRGWWGSPWFNVGTFGSDWWKERVPVPVPTPSPRREGGGGGVSYPPYRDYDYTECLPLLTDLAKTVEVYSALEPLKAKEKKKTDERLFDLRTKLSRLQAEIERLQTSIHLSGAARRKLLGKFLRLKECLEYFRHLAEREELRAARLEEQIKAYEARAADERVYRTAFLSGIKAALAEIAPTPPPRTGAGTWALYGLLAWVGTETVLPNPLKPVGKRVAEIFAARAVLELLRS